MKTTFLTILIILAISCGAWAQLSTSSVDAAGFNKLSEVQKATILANIAQQVNTDQVVKTTPEDVDAAIQKVDKWVNYGSSIGKGLGSAAKEVGVAANEFMGTPAGVITTVIIAWHFMGDAIGIPIHLLGGVLIFIFGNISLAIIVRRSRKITIVKDIAAKTETRTVEPLSDEWRSIQLTGFIILTIVSIATAFSY